MAKAALAEQGLLGSAATRLPLVEATDEQRGQIRAALATIA